MIIVAPSPSRRARYFASMRLEAVTKVRRYPRAAAKSATAIPNVPDVVSMMRPPVWSAPSAAARSKMYRAGMSFISGKAAATRLGDSVAMRGVSSARK
jgi:hypothetical protein